MQKWCHLLHLRCYSPLCALASLVISLHRSLSQVFFHHAFTSKVLRSFNMESSHLNLDLPFLLLLSGWEKVIFMQDSLSSILAICPTYFNSNYLNHFHYAWLFVRAIQFIIILYSPYPIDTTWDINCP